jgi:site-specific DNA-methyltransferase (adenine-specific)/modification methylase
MTLETTTDPDARLAFEQLVRHFGDAVTLYLADCTTLLPLPCDLVITDPPYGTGVAPKGGAKAGTIRDGSGFVPDWDRYDPAWMGLVDVPAAVFCGQATIFQTARDLGADGMLVYAKSNPSPFGTSWEPCLTRGWKRPRQRQHWHGYNAENGQEHPTQKPLALMEWIVSVAPHGRVCDPFMGSGTTGVACVNLGRQFVGVERDPGYFAVACRRIEDAMRQARLF